MFLNKLNVPFYLDGLSWCHLAWEVLFFNSTPLSFCNLILQNILEPVVTFYDGIEFIEKILDGRQIRCLIKSEGNKKLIEFQKDYETNIVITTIIREVIGDKLIQVGYFLCVIIF